MKKTIIYVILTIVAIISLPLLLDYFIFGNSFPSNIDNNAWAGFLGSYIGGVATMLAVFVTINDNNTKIKQQRIEEKKEKDVQRRLDIKPFIDTRYNFFNNEVVVGVNDRVFDVVDGDVERVRFDLTSMDRKIIETNSNSNSKAFIKYMVRNIGAGSAVDMIVSVNNMEETIAIAKDEKISLFLLVSFDKKEKIDIEVSFDFWDVESRGHYFKTEKIRINSGEDIDIISVEKTETKQI